MHRCFRAWFSLFVKRKIQSQAIALLALTIRSSLLISALLVFKARLVSTRNYYRKYFKSWSVTTQKVRSLTKMHYILTNDRRLLTFAMRNFRSNVVSQRRDHFAVLRRGFTFWRRHTEFSYHAARRAKSIIAFVDQFTRVLKKKIFPLGTGKVVATPLILAIDRLGASLAKNCLAIFRQGVCHSHRKSRGISLLLSAASTGIEARMRSGVLGLRLNRFMCAMVGRAKRAVLQAWRARRGEVVKVIGNFSAFEGRMRRDALKRWRAKTEAAGRKEISVRMLRDRLQSRLIGNFSDFRSSVFFRSRAATAVRSMGDVLARKFRVSSLWAVRTRLEFLRRNVEQKVLLEKVGEGVRRLVSRKLVATNFRFWATETFRSKRHGNFSRKISEMHKRVRTAEVFRRWRAMSAVRNFRRLQTRVTGRLIASLQAAGVDRRIRQSRVARLAQQIGNCSRARLRQAMTRLLVFRGLSVLGNFVMVLQTASMRRALTWWRSENSTISRVCHAKRVAVRLEATLRRKLAATGLGVWRRQVRMERMIACFVRRLSSIWASRGAASFFKRLTVSSLSARHLELLKARVESRRRVSESALSREVMSGWLGIVVHRREKELVLSRKTSASSLRRSFRAFAGHQAQAKASRKLVRLLDRKCLASQALALQTWKLRLDSSRRFRSAVSRLIAALRVPVRRSLARNLFLLKTARSVDVSTLRLHQGVRRKRQALRALQLSFRKFRFLGHCVRRVHDRLKSLALGALRTQVTAVILTSHVGQERLGREKLTAHLTAAKFLILAAATAGEERNLAHCFRKWRRDIVHKRSVFGRLAQLVGRRLLRSGWTGLDDIVRTSLADERDRARALADEIDRMTTVNARKERATLLFSGVLAGRISRDAFLFFSQLRKAMYARSLTAVQRACRAEIADRENEKRRNDEDVNTLSKELMASQSQNFSLSRELAVVSKEIDTLRGERETINGRLRDSVEEVELVASRMATEKREYARARDNLDALQREVAVVADLRQANERLKLEVERWKLQASEAKFSESLLESEGQRLTEEVSRLRNEAAENRLITESEIDSLRLSMREDSFGKHTLAKSHSFYKSKCQLLTEQVKALERRLSESVPALTSQSDSRHFTASWDQPLLADPDEDVFIGDSLASLQVAIQGRSGLRRQRL